MTRIFKSVISTLVILSLVAVLPAEKQQLKLIKLNLLQKMIATMLSLPVQK